MNLNKIVKVFTSKFVGTGPSSYKKKKNLPSRGLTEVKKHCSRCSMSKAAGANVHGLFCVVLRINTNIWRNRVMQRYRSGLHIEMQITTRGTVLTEKPVDVYLDKKKKRNFSSWNHNVHYLFKSAYHRILDESVTPRLLKLYLILSFHLHLCLPIGHFISVFLTQRTCLAFCNTTDALRLSSLPIRRGDYL